MGDEKKTIAFSFSFIPLPSALIPLYTRRTTAFVLSVLLGLVWVGGASGQRRRSVAPLEPAAPAASRPITNQQARARLVLLIVVDQFRYDYLERFGDLFVRNGIARLLREGASWADANYDHAPTKTAPGHATIMTGTWPAEHGIIANDWFDRETGKKVASVTDDTTALLGGREGERGQSPRRLLASTLGDELRLATNERSKVIGISSKSRSAILPAGRHASAAYWFNTNNGRMVSSSYYFDRLPQWVEQFNQQGMADKFFGRRWERLLPEAEYTKRLGRDAQPWENIAAPKSDTQTFPHTVTGGAAAPSRAFYKELDYSPFSNEMLLAFAKQAIEHEGLGADADTDLLSVSFSGNDYVGHRFGPYSQEVMDVALRVDRQIAELLDYVQQHVGLQNTLVVFTADHGVAPIPEHAQALNLPGRRIQEADIFKTIMEGLRARYARKGEADRTGDYIQKFQDLGKTKEGFINNNVYLNLEALKRDHIGVEEFERAIGEAAMQMPGTARYFTRAQLEAGAVPTADPVARRVLHGFHPQRSGDVVIVNAPFNVNFGLPDDPTDPRSSATHESPYSYDTHVPLIIMGRGLTAGRYAQAASPADIAPTLSIVLGVQAPSNATGRVLIEALTTK
ncbi:MAG TPA: alkaline phosphatase family protein [Pyrinomonadaceae bacterium]|jgi:predicted AlkP superfamily pyrophosphatase or phosphodiesterase